MTANLIQTMSKQAIDLVNKEHPGIGPDVWIDAYNKKFAELIVNECIEVVLSSDPSPKMIAHEPYRTIMNNIVERFGVEE